MRHTTGLLIVLVLLTAFATPHAQGTRVEPIRAQSGPSPVRFDRLDVADGSFAVFNRDDVYARHMGISDLGAERVQVTERLQVLPLSGGDPTRARFACVTAEGVMFGSEISCDRVRVPAAPEPR